MKYGPIALFVIIVMSGFAYLVYKDMERASVRDQMLDKLKAEWLYKNNCKRTGYTRSLGGIYSCQDGWVYRWGDIPIKEQE